MLIRVCWFHWPRALSVQHVWASGHAPPMGSTDGCYGYTSHGAVSELIQNRHHFFFTGQKVSRVVSLFLFCYEGVDGCSCQVRLCLRWFWCSAGLLRVPQTSLLRRIYYPPGAHLAVTEHTPVSPDHMHVSKNLLVRKNMCLL